MPERWLGHLRGSRTGTLFLEVADDGTSVLTIGLAGAGDMKLRVTSLDSSVCRLLLENSDDEFGLLTIESRTEERIDGSWNFISGAGGIFDLIRHTVPPRVAEDAATPSARVWSRDVQLGAVTLYRPDMHRLVAELRGLIERPCIVAVRALEGSNIVAQDADHYLARQDYVDVVRVLTLAAEEITSHPFKRIASVRLDQDSTNVFVSSTEEIWTTAASMQLADYTRQFTSRTTGLLRRHGLNINAFILIAILIWMPDRPLVERVIVFILGVLVIAGITRSHRLIPYNRVFLDPAKERRPFAKEVPALIMGLLAAVVTAFLSSVPAIIDFFSSSFDRITQ